MMSVLLESAAVRGPRRTRWTAASIAIHGALIAGAVALTTRTPVAGAVDEPIPEQPTFIQLDEPTPPRRAPRVPDAPVLPRGPVSPVPIPPLTSVVSFDPGIPFAATPVSAEEIFAPRPRPDSIAGAGPPNGVFTGATVERIASPLAGNGQPDYPSSLRGMGLEGEVLVTFVVDTNGRAEPGSITVVSATHELFADAVKRWLPRTRYAPAEVGGRPVRQLVQQVVGFTVAR